MLLWVVCTYFWLKEYESFDKDVDGVTEHMHCIQGKLDKNNGVEVIFDYYNIFES